MGETTEVVDRNRDIVVGEVCGTVDGRHRKGIVARFTSALRRNFLAIKLEHTLIRTFMIRRNNGRFLWSREIIFLSDKSNDLSGTVEHDLRFLPQP